jgi:hypothetical protein
VVDVGEPGRRPAQVDVAGCLHHPLAGDHPLPVVPVAARRQVVLQDRGGRLLELQEQRVVPVSALEQDDVGPGADAAHADHLAGQVEHLEPFQQLAVVVAEGGPVGAELLPEQALHAVGRDAVGGLQVPRRDDHRRPADDPVAPVDQLGELRQRLQAVTGARLGRLLARHLPGPLRRPGALLRLEGVARVSALLKALLRPATVKLAAIHLTSYSNGPGRVSSKSFRSTSSWRSGEANTPKLEKVGVAAQLDLEAGRGRALQVGGHDLGRPR